MNDLTKFKLDDWTDRLVLADLLLEQNRHSEERLCRGNLPIKWNKGKVILWVNQFAKGYIEAALSPFRRLGYTHNIEDIAPDTLEEMVRDCRDIYREYHREITSPLSAGRSFFLARGQNGFHSFSGIKDWNIASHLLYILSYMGKYTLDIGVDGKLHGKKVN